MKYALLYYALLILLFFSSTYAVDTSFYPDIENEYYSNDYSTTNDNYINTVNDSSSVTTISSDGKIGRSETMQFKEDERINKLVQIQQKICLDTIGPGDHWKNGYNYSCENQTLVRTAENGGWFWDRKSPTDDHGYCQLHYRRHKDFIDSPEFADQYKQLTYCNEVWMDAYKKGRMPWMAYGNRNAMKSRFIISQ